MASSKGTKTKSKPDEAPIFTDEWVVVQLSSSGEKEKDIDLIYKSIYIALGYKVDIFIPAVVQKAHEDSQTLRYMEGYVFIKYSPSIHYGKLNDRGFFSKVLCSFDSKKNKRSYHLLNNDVIDVMKKAVQDLKIREYVENDKVRVINGTYKNMTGVIGGVDYDKSIASVIFNFRSKKSIIEFPFSYLEKIDQ